jgi:hypothetical protein
VWSSWSVGMPAITMISFSRWSGGEYGKPFNYDSRKGGK